MAPVTRSSTVTRARITRCTTARTSVLDLNQRLAGALVFEAQRDAVPQFAAGVQSLVEQVSRHDVRERLQHRLLDAGVFDLEIQEQALDSVPIEAEVPAGR